VSSVARHAKQADKSRVSSAREAKEWIAMIDRARMGSISARQGGMGMTNISY